LKIIGLYRLIIYLEKTLKIEETCRIPLLKVRLHLIRYLISFLILPYLR